MSFKEGIFRKECFERAGSALRGRNDQILTMARLPRACIATTVRDPGPGFDSFLRYHLAIGFERIYVFFDDPKDDSMSVARRFDGVTVVPRDSRHEAALRGLRLFDKLGPFCQSEVMARQRLNVEMAIEMARREGLDWIFHIDADELIHSQNQSILERLAGVPVHISEIVLLNHEAVPQTMEVGDPFAEVTLFKRNPVLISLLGKRERKMLQKHFPSERPFFFAYVNGKAAARLSADVLPNCVHRFRRSNGPTETTTFDGLFVYHYPNCGFDEYLLKYHRLGKFADRWFGRQLAGPEFHLRSRDAFAAGDFRALKKLYQANVQFSDSAAIRTLLQSEILEENRAMSDLIRRLQKQKTPKRAEAA